MSRSFCWVCDGCGRHTPGSINSLWMNEQEGPPPGWYVQMSEPGVVSPMYCTLRCLINATEENK